MGVTCFFLFKPTWNVRGEFWSMARLRRAALSDSILAPNGETLFRNLVAQIMARSDRWVLSLVGALGL